MSTIAELIRAACHPVAHLCFADITDGHAVTGYKDGRALRPDGRDVQALIVASCFEGRSSLERQRLVNDALYAQLSSGELHSLQVRCWTPSQWELHGRPTNLGKPCTVVSGVAVIDGTMPDARMALPACSEPSPQAIGQLRQKPQDALQQTAGQGDEEDEEQQGRLDLTEEALVVHMLEKGAADALICARQIIECDHSSDTAKNAARLIIARGDA
mmetsp:Transcript_52194/g.117222  ORF Transcript_52194/g.117222 Transcript_52194/m.117222 type:complete len:215 (-) Transcript_52194:249-893(-)|eukprot:CAMPEP_0181211184 /NCGR_PEP_ID=MMETSP1096-20121128/23644_1 /TAXON_ID=156174 ORGANISM="Chrysochromulina ericina, Strain CCMP281" /NCGR_SAMPLE_ID=MMETSP1096 /ASSEMBLY_ACC=CAM_ASM_000453 /LENGTH=214 /DNA_ID=CAMNT_0023302555 /DNA_START=47 /DNA_END=691 /DNA_ORIENTATION=-